jgi:predicted Zn-dependent peptidase
MEKEQYQYHTLPNGIRVVHKQVAGMVAHAGVLINAGSRDEEPDEHGLAHFIEHTFFKGTQRRRAFHVISRLDTIGAELNAFTTKEETMIYASFLKEYYSRTLELLADIVFSSVFPDHELRKEKEVVRDEIDSYKDTPSEMIFDQFEEETFKGHSLGRNILGTKRNIRKFSREQIHHFLNRNYQSNQIVIASVGDIRFEKLIKYVSKYFKAIDSSERSHQRKLFDDYKPFEKTVSKKVSQNHCIIGNVAYNFYEEDKKLILTLLSNLLGGTGMNSRLNLSIRERRGYAYHVESNYNPYVDTGLFNIYLGCNNGYLEPSIELVHKELKALREKPLGPVQLNMAKRQMIGQMAIYYESNLNEMLSIAKSCLLYNKVESLEEIAEKINAVSAAQMMEVANEIFEPRQLSTLIYKKPSR